VIVTSSSDIGPAGAFLRLALWSVGTVIAAAALGAWPTYALAGRAGIVGLLWGMGIALVSALIGLVPPALTLRGEPPQRLRGTLTGALLRFLVMLALLLAVDTAGVIWLTKRVARRTM
jgi:hypothetical protein